MIAIERAPNIKGRVAWKFKCDCGNIVVLEKSRVLCGNDYSCGCQKRNQCRTLCYKHGMTDSPLYLIWKGMKQRCYNKNSNGFKNYGGRNIKICNEWVNNFQAFYEWSIYSGYKQGLSIDRIDNNGDYCPEYCRWASHIEQSNNTRKNRYLIYMGKTQTMSEWAREMHMPVNTLRTRLNLGWNVEDAISVPTRMHKPYKKRKSSMNYNQTGRCPEARSCGRLKM